MINAIKRLEYLKLNADKKFGQGRDYPVTLGHLEDGIDALIEDLKQEVDDNHRKKFDDEFAKYPVGIVAVKRVTAADVINNQPAMVHESLINRSSLKKSLDEWCDKQSDNATVRAMIGDLCDK